MQQPTPSERLRRALWNAIAEDDWAQSDLDSAVSDYVRDAQDRGAPIAEISRSLRVHVQQVGLGLSASRYELVARHVVALAETAFRGVFRGVHSTRTVNIPAGDADES